MNKRYLMNFIYLLVLFSVNTYAEKPCIKTLKVKVYEKQLDFTDNPNEKNEKTYLDTLKVSCEQYKKIKVGDKLKLEENIRSVKNTGLFPIPVLIQRKFLILEK